MGRFDHILNKTVEELEAIISNKNEFEMYDTVFIDIITRRSKYLKLKAEEYTPDIIQDMTIAEVNDMSKRLDLAELTLETITAIQAKLSTIYTEDKSNSWAIFSHTNIRHRALTNMITVGMVAYLYRALREHSDEFSGELNTMKLTDDEARGVKKFLDTVFQYNPTESIDRYSEEINSARKDEVLKGEVNPFSKLPEPLKKYYKEVSLGKTKVDFTANATKSKKKKKAGVSRGITYKAAAELTDSDGKVTTVDIPSDFFGKFTAYYNLNYDAIHTIASEMYIYCANIAPEDAEYKHVQERVTLFGIKQDGTTEVIGPAYRDFPITPACMLESTISIRDKIFQSKEKANAEMGIVANRYPVPWFVAKTNTTILIGEWRVNQQTIQTTDAHLNAIMKKLDEDLLIGQELLRGRTKRAKMLDLINNGPMSKEFKDWCKKNNPGIINPSDEEEEEELMEAYRNWMNENNIYDESNIPFMEWCKRMLPNRNFNLEPLTHHERIEFSKRYNNDNVMPELPQDIDMIGIDLTEMGDTEIEGIKMTRVYTDAPEIDRSRST